MLQRIEACYDALPRTGARPEQVGPLTLFVRAGVGWPFYARPSPGAGPVTADDVAAVRRRQVELGVPQALEWVEDLCPSLAGAAQAAGLVVRHCPLLVLSGAPVTTDVAATVRVLSGDEPDLAVCEAVAHVGFGAGHGTRVGPAGAAERDAAALASDPARIQGLRVALADGSAARVVADDPALGPVAVGGYQHALGVAEIVGVATLPAVRRRGLAGAVTARLAGLAVERGLTTVFLSAQDDDVARVYERIGFTRIGTAGLAEPG